MQATLLMPGYYAESHLCKIVPISYTTTIADDAQHVHVQAAHSKHVVNRDVRPSNLMHIQSAMYLVDWVSATLHQRALYDGTIHYASVQVLQQLVQELDRVEVGPSDDLESLVASVFCISHPDAHKDLQRVARSPAKVVQWWTEIWASRPQWQLALTAARAANHDTVAACLQALME